MIVNTKENTLKQGIASYIMLCLFAAWNVFFFMPLDIYIPNAGDIQIPLKPLAACLGLVTLAVFAVTLLICVFTKGKANRIFRAALFGVSIAFYIQGNFLAVNMGEFNGEKYTLSFWKTALSIVVWLAVLVGVFVLEKKLPEEFDGLVGRIAAALIIVQIIALSVSAYNNIPRYGLEEFNMILKGESISYCTTKDFGLYSKNKNVIIILADEYDSYLFDGAVEEDPDSVSEFDGFTYYVNTVGKYGLTSPSMAYITSGKGGEKYADLTFFKATAENFRANFYSSFDIPPVSVLDDFYDNTGFVKMTFGESMMYTKDVCRLAFFRCVPEPLKPLLWFDAQNIGGDIRGSLEKRLTQYSDIGLYNPDNLAFYNSLPRELDLTDENVFKFMYIFGLHHIRTVTKDLEYIETSTEVSPEEEAIAVNKIVNEYLKILKENGIYDNCEIIFMADHGLKWHRNKMYPLLMYKPANQTETGIKISRAPISYDEMFPTLKMLAGAEPGGRTIFDIAEDEQRVRHFADNGIDITETEKPHD